MVHTSGLTIVANRLPVDITYNTNGIPSYRRSPGGLVTALEPLLRKNGGAWVGWPGSPSGDTENFEPQFTLDGITMAPVPLTEQEIASYYEGFSNATLWPLYHDVIERPQFHRAWWNSYVTVNQRFAQAAAKTANNGDTVWVHDYQLQLVPRMLRELRPDLTIGFFLHIPFPPTELFMQIPTRIQIINGLLGANLIGFHLDKDVQNFLSLIRHLSQHPVIKKTFTPKVHNSVITYNNHTITTGAFPISIDSKTINTRVKSHDIRARAQQIRSDLGYPKKILLGVDRLDYTKGIDVRLRAFQELLEDGRINPAETIFVQIATPSREKVESYQKLRDLIELHISRINGDWGSLSRPAVHYIHRQISRDELLAFFTIADVMLVTPLRDGMNLVAKEYIACRIHADGALVLSEFTGAAVELSSAYIVNPHDIDNVKDAIDTALHQSPEEEKRRITALRRQVLKYDVSLWAHNFLSAVEKCSHDN